MLNWDVDVRSVRKFVTRMCKKTCLSHDQRQSIMVPLFSWPGRCVIFERRSSTADFV
jgi:hypothetical protein